MAKPRQLSAGGGYDSMRQVVLDDLGLKPQLLIEHRPKLGYFSSAAPGSNTQNVSLGSPSVSNAASRSVMGESMVSQVS